MVQDIKFDILLPKIQAKTQSRVFRILSEKIAAYCASEAEKILQMCMQDSKDRVFSPSEGLAILDIKSRYIKKPVSVLATLDAPVAFEPMKGQSADLIAVIISPASHGSFHLQKLAPLTRSLSDNALCKALRGAEDEDAMSSLFIKPLEADSEAA